eukprot:CAMPEP_0202974494 /NCGR_PEP_ID=MMETSP1396-20130829/60928_1 /ASSEMBLY_ACC=CAM_ASM_000872 /TAXON_ID= /ORGANISM="Pseudokeronopsis sp., Strain Brazil" /LENGTH=65 /DNA_ID=CAMNT_0049708431 /DNA_START=172 /DNA_END=369 /DNA_ORIENTATION=-
MASSASGPTQTQQIIKGTGNKKIIKPVMTKAYNPHELIDPQENPFFNQQLPFNMPSQDIIQFQPL